LAGDLRQLTLFELGSPVGDYCSIVTGVIDGEEENCNGGLAET
jgi:hypothetical protein